jgi:hypothetical protein
MPYSISAVDFKSSEVTTLPSTNYHPREYWRIHGTSWRSLFELPPGWKQATLEYHHTRGNQTLIAETPPEDLKRLRRLMSDSVSHERAWDEISCVARERFNEAPKATYDAVVHELRTNGLSQFRRTNCQRRLANLSTAQIKNLMVSLQQRRGQYPNISDELLTALGEIYDVRMASNA